MVGNTAYVADIDCEGCLHAHFVRSTEAHARIVSIALEQVLEHPEVVAVYTAATIGLGPHVHIVDLPAAMNRHALADGRVRHVGEAVAVVIASSERDGEDASELAVVELDPLEVVVDPTRALDQDHLYPEAGTNLVYDIDDDGADPLTTAHHIVDVLVTNQRVTSAPIETDRIVAWPTDRGIDIWCTTQGVHGYRREFASALGLELDEIRVRAPAVGGAFGGRVALPVEFVVVARAAMKLGRPVRWNQTRFENLTCMPQGRDLRSRFRLGLAADGTFTGLDVDVVADVGATAHGGAALLPSVRRHAVGLYRVPNLRWRGRAVLTNKTPVGAYRGAGQPEANHARERTIDIAAHRLGIDPVELRLMNLASVDAFPFTAAGGVVYDSADPGATLRRAVALVGLEAWRAEQRTRRERGDHMQIGVGVCCYAQTTGGGDRSDSALVRIGETGRVLLACGTPSHGQGHRTTWTNLVSAQLGVAHADIDVVDTDSDAIGSGLTTGGSRASQVLASLIVRSCQELVELARPIVSAELEAAEADLVVVETSHGLAAGLAVQGVPTRRMTWAEIAGSSERSCLEVAREGAPPGAAHPYGCHASVVEVDTETGFVRLVDHVAVDDCGTVLEPVIVRGQQHGGSAAGIAQALWEFMAFDESGNPQTALFTNYGLPSAAEMCSITTATMETPTDRNILGTRGIGENGCNGATAAVHNAVIDALTPFGIEHIDLPLTPQRLWRAMHSTKR